MQEGIPSRTAYRVALRRAAHQVYDHPLIFPDPLALRILGLDGASAKNLAQSDLRAPTRPHSIALRAFLVARSKFAEETLSAAVLNARVSQYVLLGAGLDTFAYRNPHGSLRVFEVDHPATQHWKLLLLQDTYIPIPTSVTHVPVNFQCDDLAGRLARAGFNRAQPAIFACLGVIPYLSEVAFASTLHYLSGSAPGSVLVMDYSLPREALPSSEQLAFDSLQARVTAAGEPFQLSFTTEALQARLASDGWQVTEDLGRDAINARFFSGRADGLRCLGMAGHLLSAQLRIPKSNHPS